MAGTGLEVRSIVDPSAASIADVAMHDRLTLADWRRRVADLYAAVRTLSATDPAAALAHWRTVREALYRDHPQSPVPAERRRSFRASHFEHDPALRFEVAVEADEPAAHGTSLGAFDGTRNLALPVSAGDPMRFERLGFVRIPFPDGERRLGLYWMSGYAGGLFLPFRDATNGSETYAAGRYVLDAAKSADLGGDADRGTIVVDFNFAFQPSCAFDPRWACPLAPPENRLDIAIRAGERLS